LDDGSNSDVKLNGSASDLGNGGGGSSDGCWKLMLDVSDGVRSSGSQAGESEIETVLDSGVGASSDSRCM
jgi:hypothetical protein